MITCPCGPACTYGVGTITWHVITRDDGITLSVVRPDRGDAAPVNVWHRGSLVPIRARHVAVGGHCWSASPCECRDVRPERQPVRRGHLAAVAS